MKLTQILDNIDLSLEAKADHEKILVKLMAPIAFFAIAYFVLIPDSSAFFEQKTKQQVQLVQNKQTTQELIKAIKQTNQIERLEREIEETQTNIDLQIVLQEDAENKLISLQAKQKEWQALLELVSASAKSNTLSIQTLETRVDETTNIDFQIINIDINGSGTFHNVMKFVNDVESFGIFVQINEVLLDMDKKLNFDMKVSSKRIKL